MNYEEFAFFNQQLAALLRDGNPLEGALKELCVDLNSGPLRAEMQKLQVDLEHGAKLTEAVAPRKLPNFYKQMIGVGVASNDLPGTIAMLAEYYQREHSLWSRLKGLLVYPLIVLCTVFLLSCAISFAWNRVIWPSMSSWYTGFGWGREFDQLPTYTQIASQVWMPPVLFGVTLALAIAGVFVPRFRTALCWRLPAFKDAAVAQTASAMSTMLRSGVNLDDAIRLLEDCEPGTRARSDLAMWRGRLASGLSDFGDIGADSRSFPRLFIWLAANGGEDLAAGFKRAASVYQARSQYRTDTILYAVLPVAILSLGMMIVGQVYVALSAMIPFFFTLVNYDSF